MRELHWNLFEKQLGRLAQARVICVSLDESTDVPTKEMLVVYLSWVDEMGVPHVEFVWLPRMMGTSATNIYGTIKTLLKKCGLYDKLVALGSDGASVMTGKKKGVGAKLRGDVAYLLAMHCVCHKLALGANDAAGLVSFSAEIGKLLMGIGRLVRKSAKRHERFEEIAKLYDEAHESIKRLHGVRWLSRGQVLCSVTGNINTICDLAKEMSTAAARRLADDDESDAEEGDSDEPGVSPEDKKYGPKEVLERLADFKYVGALFFLSDLISVVNMVSTSFHPGRLGLLRLVADQAAQGANRRVHGPEQVQMACPHV